MKHRTDIGALRKLDRALVSLWKEIGLLWHAKQMENISLSCKAFVENRLNFCWNRIWKTGAKLSCENILGHFGTRLALCEKIRTTSTYSRRLVAEEVREGCNKLYLKVNYRNFCYYSLVHGQPSHFGTLHGLRIVSEKARLNRSSQ